MSDIKRCSHELSRACSGIAPEIDATLEFTGLVIKKIIAVAIEKTGLKNPRQIWGVSWETIETWDKIKPQAAALKKLISSVGFERLLGGHDRQVIWNAYFERGSESVLSTNAPFAYDFVASLSALLRKVPENSFVNLHHECQ